MACTCGPGQQCDPLKPGCWGYQPPQTTDLVAALRDSRNAGHLNLAAADEIERLRAEIANLNRGINKVRERGLAWQKDAVERVRDMNAERFRNV